MAGTKAVETGNATQAEEGVYSRRFLRFYDVLVYRVNLPMLWRCPPRRLFDLYAENLSPRHLEIGVGTGYLLDKSRFPVEGPSITLMDVSASPLAYSAGRLERYAPRIHQASVVSPWQLPAQSFDSVAMANVLHCVPGTLREKGAASFGQASSALAPGGTLFGSTVLGEDASHTRRSRSAIRRLNQKGVFHNLEDRLEDLDAELGRAFASHELEVSGVMALFVARTES